MSVYDAKSIPAEVNSSTKDPEVLHAAAVKECVGRDEEGIRALASAL
jgi:hypothetical protein